MLCPVCGLDTRPHERHCPNCLTDLGFPNVRAARKSEEVDALEARVTEATARASADGTRAIMEQYGEALVASVVTVCRQYSDVLDLLKSDDELYASFALLVESLRRRPSARQIDISRRGTDAIFFPYFEKEIRFGALSLDGLGAPHYGPVSIVLKPAAISQRTSFFEKNTVEFAIKHDLGPGRPVPPGFRSDWEGRSKLGVAKGADRIGLHTTPSDFPRIALDGDDFIEAHIYGPIHRRAIERLIVRAPTRRVDMAFLSAIGDTIARDGLPIEIQIV